MIKLMETPIRIGVLAIQGAFYEHILFLKLANETSNILNNLQIIEIRNAKQLTPEIDGLIIPGGESTTMAKFLESQNFKHFYEQWLKTPRINSNHRHIVWGTCAGLILLSDNILHQKHDGQFHLGGLHIVCDRNANGRQRESHEKLIKLFSGSVDTQRAIFIRSPRIHEITNYDEVEILSSIVTNVLGTDGKEKEEAVAIRQNNLLGTTFHPELSLDKKYFWHTYFLKMFL